MHIADFAVGMLGANGIVGGGLPLATGAALAAQIEGKGNVAICFFGDGAVAEGEFHEALNVSSVWKLPILFVCENNQYAANNAIAVQHPITDVAVRAASYGLPGFTIDGNDALAVYEATRSAVDRARRGEGPTLIECKTYRWYFHAMRDKPGCLAVRLTSRQLAEADCRDRPPLRPGLHAMLSVTDTGSGMEPAVLARIFEPFFTTKGPGEGTGLGLAMVHGLMRDHDGGIFVSSQPGVGTTFELFFPAAAETTHESPMFY